MIYFFILLGVIYLFLGLIFTNYFTVIFLPDEIFLCFSLSSRKKDGILSTLCDITSSLAKKFTTFAKTDRLKIINEQFVRRYDFE